jgi:restriction system protein
LGLNSEALARGLLSGVFEGVLLAWPLWAILVAIAAVKLAVRLHDQRRLARSGIAEIDRMDGPTFEQYLEVLFERLGFAVVRTRSVGDYGADLVVRKDGVRTIIQAKRHQRRVGVKAVQEAVAAKGYYGCSEAMVVTNSYYTKQAAELARANGVILWDRRRLVEALLSVQEAQRVGANAKDARPATDGEAPSPVSAGPAVCEPVSDRCCVCGKQVTERVRRFCLTRSNQFGGNVYCYDHQVSSRSRPAAVDQ